MAGRELHFILRGMFLQEEWRCAWEACLDFARNHRNKFGRKEWIRYYFEGESFDGEICIEVWRSQRGIEAVRAIRERKGEVPCE